MKHFTWVTHTFSDKDPSKMIAKEGKHFYQNPQGIEYPSVTGMISKTSDKTGLEIWKKNVGESVAQHIFKTAGEVGTATHTAAESYLKNDFSIGKGLLLNGHFNQLKPLLDKIDNIRACEIGLYSDNMKLGGTSDCIAEHQGVLSVIDFKTSRKRKYKSMEQLQGYFIQATCYAMMWEELTGERIERIVVMISTEDGYIQEYIENPSNYTEALKSRINQFNQIETVTST